MTRKKILLLIAILLLGCVSCFGLYVYSIYMSLTETEQLDVKKLGVNKELDTQVVNVALFGVDGRDDENVEGDRTDSIMIGTLDPVNKTIKVTSVMRDTFAKICYPDSKEKVTENGTIYAGDTDGIEWDVSETETQEAISDDSDDTTELETDEEWDETETEDYSYGSEYGEDETKRVDVDYENKIYVAEYTKINAAFNNGGVQASIKTLNENFDLNIQDYITVDFNCLMDVIDTLGGITVNIPNEDVLKWTNEYLKESNGFGHRNDPDLEELGEQTITGAQALAFVRNRYSDSDFGRAERQREVVQAILEKAESIDAITAVNLVTKIYPYIKTSFTLPEIVEYASTILNSSGEYKFEGFRIPTNDHGTSGFVDQIWYLFPDTLADNVVELHQFIYGTTQDFQPSYTVEQISQEIDDYMNYSAYGVTTNIGEEMEEEMQEGQEKESENESEESIEEETETKKAPASDSAEQATKANTDLEKSKDSKGASSTTTQSTGSDTQKSAVPAEEESEPLVEEETQETDWEPSSDSSYEDSYDSYDSEGYSDTSYYNSYPDNTE